MNLNLPTEVVEIIKKVQDKGYEIYVVGGAVRDILTKRLVDDWDFTTNAVPQELLKIFPQGIYDNVFGTVMIPNDVVSTPFDLTTFRTEYGYSDTRRPDRVEWGKTLEEDLQRRDFTINALALKIINPKSKTLNKSKYENSKDKTNHKSQITNLSLITVNAELIDLFKGQEDLNNKYIRAVGNPDERFSEDALRMMRAVRIASELGYKIEEKTLQAIKKNAALINKIAKERIKDELFKIVASPHPSEGILLFREVGLMHQVLPELDETFGVEQKSPGRHHIYDVGTHCLMSLKYCPSNDPIVKLATLLHDIGKAKTFKKLETGTITFYNHELVSARLVKKIAERLRLSNKDSEKLWTLVRYHQFTVDERQTDSAIRRFIRKVGMENISDMLDLRVGDRLGGGASETSWRLEEFKKRLIEVQKQPFSIKDLKIDGNDVMQILGIKPGPKIGEVLQQLYNEVVNNKLDNKVSSLKKQVSKIYNGTR